MEEQYDKQESDNIIEPKEGQRGLSYCNNKSDRCPSLSYEFEEDTESLNQAYDILLEQLIRKFYEPD